MNEIAIGKTIRVNIIDYTYDGLGIGKVDGFPIFVYRGIIGETIDAIIIDVKKNLAFANISELVVASPNRVDPRCPYYDDCGGCHLMHMNYKEQLLFKKMILQNNITRIGNQNGFVVNDTLGMKDPYKYRNKVIEPATTIQNQMRLGMYKMKSHEVINIEKCLVREDIIDDIYHEIEVLCNEFNITAYDEKSFKGIIRNVVIKRGHYTKQIMIIFVVNDNVDVLYEMVHKLVKRFEDISSVYINLNKSRNNNILSNHLEHIYGNQFIEDELLNIKLKIGPLSFYQINTIQTEKLFSLGYQLAKPNKTENMMDAYCGIGSIGLPVAKEYKTVYGIEVVKEAIFFAKLNSDCNEINNVYYEVLDSKDIKDKLIQYNINTLFVDPPRKGLEIDFIRAIIESNITKIVYISCNPATLSRDIKIFTEEGKFRLVDSTPVDMFPQTLHIESVSFLELEEKNGKTVNFI